MLTRFRKISLLMAYAVATIPLWHYISEAHILLLMTAVVVFAYFLVVLSSVDAVQTILSSEKTKVPLPRWLPQKPKYEKWWLIVRHTLKWHLLLVPAKMGLALGSTEYFYTTEIVRGKYSFLSPYFYLNFSSWNMAPLLPYPQWETICLGIIFIMLFTLADLALISGILSSAKGNVIRILILILVLILTSVGLANTITTIYYEWSCHGMRDCLYGNHDIWLIDETVYLATNTLTEQGIFLAANIMRPRIGQWDNTLFVLRQCVAGILGVFLYLGTTWGILWFVEDEIFLKQSEQVQTSSP